MKTYKKYYKKNIVATVWTMVEQVDTETGWVKRCLSRAGGG